MIAVAMIFAALITLLVVRQRLSQMFQTMLLGPEGLAMVRGEFTALT